MVLLKIDPSKKSDMDLHGIIAKLQEIVPEFQHGKAPVPVWKKLKAV